MKRKMREVIHIKDRVGPRGGEGWVLTLDCGHKAYRIKPPFRFGRKPRFAPHRCKCILCDGE